MGSLGLGKTQTIVQGHRGVTEAVSAGRTTRAAWIENDQAIAACLAITVCILHFIFNGRYGYFRDELYYVACGQHLAWGYVDQAPLVALIARLSRAMFGDSLHALRFFPALSSGAKILLAGWMVREFGGGRFAQILAGTAILLCPIYLTMDNFMSMNAFEPVLWMACAAIAMKIIRTENQRLWLWFGLIAGIGILNKHSMLLFGLSLCVALLITSHRRVFRNRWIWLGGLIAFLLFLPNLIWEIQNNWPTIEILRNVDRMKNSHISWLTFISQQALLVHPLGTPICLAGLWFFLLSRKGRVYRFLGWTYLILLVLLIAFRGRIYYLAPAYVMLFAAGAVAIESWIRRSEKPWIKMAVLVPLIIGGIVAAPLALPILSVDGAVAYSNFWDVQDVRVEKEPSGKLPQLYADMMGWQAQANKVAGVFQSLPAEERSKTAILTENYGEAGAIDLFGSKLGLPHAISGHNSYYLWGPQQFTGEVVITVGLTMANLQPLFGQIDQAATISNEYAIPEENNVPVYVCRKPKMTLRQAWPRLKFYG
jgi:Dolichyl-phosphate-mannose-protein mannosyltransferase